MKEREEKQLEQDDDEMMYTYVRDNERKVNANSTYSSSAQHSLVARNFEDKQNTSIASHPILFSSSLSPEFIQRGVRRHRLQLASSPSSPPVESIRDQTSSHINENPDHSIESSDFPDREDVHLWSGCKRTTSNSSAKMNLGSQQPVFIVDSLETLHTLNRRLVITFPHRKSILKLGGRSVLFSSSFQTNE